MQSHALQPPPSSPNHSRVTTYACPMQFAPNHDSQKSRRSPTHTQKLNPFSFPPVWTGATHQHLVSFLNKRTVCIFPTCPHSDRRADGQRPKEFPLVCAHFFYRAPTAVVSHGVCWPSRQQARPGSTTTFPLSSHPSIPFLVLCTPPRKWYSCPHSDYITNHASSTPPCR